MNERHEGEHVTLIEGERSLRIELTEDGKAALKDRVRGTDGDGGIRWAEPIARIFSELLEDHIDSEVWSIVEPWQLGALTSAPILVRDVTFDDEMYVQTAGAVYWFERYAIECELDELLLKGFVEFDKAREDEAPTDQQETFRCEQCSKAFDTEDKALAHRC